MQTADTNVLVRALVQDPGALEQSAVAQQWLAACTALYVPQVVQLELVWILARAFGFDRGQIALLLTRLAEHPSVHLQSTAAFATGLEFLQQGADFGDGISTAEARAMDSSLVTFDRKLARRLGVAALAVGR